MIRRARPERTGPLTMRQFPRTTRLKHPRKDPWSIYNRYGGGSCKDKGIGPGAGVSILLETR